MTSLICVRMALRQHADMVHSVPVPNPEGQPNYGPTDRANALSTLEGCGARVHHQKAPKTDRQLVVGRQARRIYILSHSSQTGSAQQSQSHQLTDSRE